MQILHLTQITNLTTPFNSYFNQTYSPKIPTMSYICVCNILVKDLFRSIDKVEEVAEGARLHTHLRNRGIFL